MFIWLLLNVSQHNNTIIDGCHLTQHEELLKPRQVLSTSSRPTIPVLAIPSVGLKATISCIMYHLTMTCTT